MSREKSSRSGGTSTFKGRRRKSSLWGDQRKNNHRNGYTFKVASKDFKKIGVQIELNIVERPGNIIHQKYLMDNQKIRGNSGRGISHIKCGWITKEDK